MEERGGKTDAFRRRIQAAKPIHVNTHQTANREWDHQGPQTDSQLDEPVGENRPADSMRPASGESSAQRQARHIGCENRDYSEFGGPKDKGEFPSPGCLVEKRGEARYEKTHLQQLKAHVHRENPISFWVSRTYSHEGQTSTSTIPSPAGIALLGTNRLLTWLA